MNSESLTTGESAIYDRQLRLWGSNAQVRIKSAKVVVVGLSRSTVEIVKNIVLAGASLELYDSRKVTCESTNFLIQLEVSDPGDMTVAEATAFAAHRLNEHPCVVSRESLDGLADVSAIIVSFACIDYSALEAVRLSEVARKIGASFFLVLDSDSVCWSFSDFGKTHTVEDHTPPLKRDDQTGHRKSSAVQQEEFHFVTLREFIQSEPLEVSKRVPKEIVFMHRWLRHLLLGQALVEEYSKLLDGIRTPAGPHFAAIQGALIAQEVIKFVTKRDPPLVNTLLVNQVDCSCIVCKVPSILQRRLIGEIPTQENDDNEVEFVSGIADLD